MSQVALQFSQRSVPAGSYDVSGLYPERREEWPRFNHVSEHVQVNLNLLRALTNKLGDRGVKSVTIEDTTLWSIDTDPTVETYQQTYEEDFVKKFFPKDHLLPSAEYALGVVMALIKQQPIWSAEGQLAKSNRFYYRSEGGHACDLDVKAMSDGWYLDGGQACFYNRVWHRSTRLFSANDPN